MVAKRNLVGASNDTKWNELISFIRAKEGWKPPYRCKGVFGGISKWDGEWFYHLPFPFVGVEWFEMYLLEHIHIGKLMAPKVLDHSPTLVGKLHEIGFDFEVQENVVRIWGYLPRSYEDFPPSQA